MKHGKGCDSSEIFDRYKIAETENYRKNLNQYDVIYLNIQDFLSVADSVEEMIASIQSQVLEELQEQYPEKMTGQEKFLGIALAKLYSKTKEGFMFIIDEWDCILREKKHALIKIQKTCLFHRKVFFMRYMSRIYLLYFLSFAPY